jgi:hypothetical protein
MIHKPSRDALALALRRFAAGRIHNDALDEIDVDWRDRGAVAVKEAACHLYSDTRQHYAAGKDRLPRETRRIVARWIVFLHSRREYLWPEYSFIQIVNWPVNLLTFGWWERRKEARWKEFQEAGDFEAWPFIRAAELGRAVRRPRFFTGARAER